MRIKARQRVFIQRPAEEIFTYLSDLEHMTSWSSALVSIHKMTPEAICAGTLVQSTLSICDKRLEMIFEIVEYEPHSCLSFKSISGCTPCLVCYQFEPGEDGGTTLSVDVMLQLIEESCDLEEPIITYEIHRLLAYDLRTFKDMLESRAELRGGEIDGRGV